MPTSRQLLSGVFALLLFTAPPAVRAADPDFQEVLAVVRAHLPEAKNADIKETTVDGLLARFGGKLKWVASGQARNTSASAVPSFSKVLDGRYVYLRPTRLEAAAEMGAFLKTAAASNSIFGGILDLRFAAGTDCAAAVQTASLLVADRKPILDCGEGVRSTEGNAVLGRVPWAVLVNRETQGAVEALAAALRSSGTGVLIGGRTAGQAGLYEEFELKTGQRLAIATRSFLAGDKQTIPGTGLVPDVMVSVTVETERAVMAAFASRTESPAPVQLSQSSKSSTNAAASRATRRRLNEAELVRMQREGRRSEPESSAAPTDTAQARSEDESADPVLARGLDFLKALSVLRSKSSAE